jgi:hypothetical protein
MRTIATNHHHLSAGAPGGSRGIGDTLTKHADIGRYIAPQWQSICSGGDDQWRNPIGMQCVRIEQGVDTPFVTLTGSGVAVANCDHSFHDVAPPLKKL